MVLKFFRSKVGSDANALVIEDLSTGEVLVDHRSVFQDVILPAVAPDAERWSRSGGEAACGCQSSPLHALWLALPIAVKANEISNHENWYYLDTLGHALAANGKYEKAIKVQTKAVEIGKALGDSGVEDAAKALSNFKKAMSSDF